MGNRGKSTFITAYIVLTVAAAAYASVELIRGGAAAGWLGVLLCYLPLVLFLAWSYLGRPPARTGRGLALVTVPTLAGGGLVVIDAFAAVPAGLAALVLGIGGVTLYLVYLLWYSRLERNPQTRLLLGEPLPRFVLRDLDGRSWDTGKLIGRPAVLIFYRGNWCPLCMAQVREVAAQYQRLAELGAQILLISPQPETHTRKLAARFDVPLRFMIDRDSKAAHQLGIGHAKGVPAGMQILGYASDTVLPTAIVTDAGGNVVYLDRTDNYRVRPEPQTYISILEASATPSAS